MRKIILSALLASTVAATAFAAPGQGMMELYDGIKDGANGVSVSAVTYTVPATTSVADFLSVAGKNKVAQDAKTNLFKVTLTDSKKAVWCGQIMGEKKSSPMQVVCGAKQSVVTQAVSAAQACRATAATTV